MTISLEYPTVEVSHLLTSAGYLCEVDGSHFVDAQAFLGTPEDKIESTILKIDWSKPNEPKTLSEYDPGTNTITVYTERLAKRLGRTISPLVANWSQAIRRSNFNAALSSMFAFEAYVQAGESIAAELKQSGDTRDYSFPDHATLEMEAESFRRSRHAFSLFENVVELEWALADGPFLELYGGHVILTSQRSEQLAM